MGRERLAAVCRAEGGRRRERFFVMEFDPTMQEGLRRSSARFMASMTRILEQVGYGIGVAAGSGRCPETGEEAGTESSRAVCAGPRTPVPWQERAGESEVPGYSHKTDIWHCPCCMRDLVTSAS